MVQHKAAKKQMIYYLLYKLIMDYLSMIMMILEKWI